MQGLSAWKNAWYKVALHKYLLNHRVNKMSNTSSHKKRTSPSLCWLSTGLFTFASIIATSSQNTFDCRCDQELKKRRREPQRSLCEKGLGEHSPAALLVTVVAFFLLLEGQGPGDCLLVWQVCGFTGHSMTLLNLFLLQISVALWAGSQSQRKRPCWLLVLELVPLVTSVSRQWAEKLFSSSPHPLPPSNHGSPLGRCLLKSLLVATWNGEAKFICLLPTSNLDPQEMAPKSGDSDHLGQGTSSTAGFS